MKYLTYTLAIIFTLNLAFIIWAQTLPKTTVFLEFINQQLAEDQARLENNDAEPNINAYGVNEDELKIRTGESIKAEIADSYHTKLQAYQTFNFYLRILLIINCALFFFLFYISYNMTSDNQIDQAVDSADNA